MGYIVGTYLYLQQTIMDGRIYFATSISSFFDIHPLLFIHLWTWCHIRSAFALNDCWHPCRRREVEAIHRVRTVCLRICSSRRRRHDGRYAFPAQLNKKWIKDKIKLMVLIQLTWIFVRHFRIAIAGVKRRGTKNGIWIVDAGSCDHVFWKSGKISSWK